MYQLKFSRELLEKMSQKCVLCTETITENSGRRMTDIQKPQIVKASVARGLKIHESPSFQSERKVLWYHNRCCNDFKNLKIKWAPKNVRFSRQRKPSQDSALDSASTTSENIELTDHSEEIKSDRVRFKF